MDKKARVVITLYLSENVAFNIQKETSARGMMTALSNMYEKPSVVNKVYFIREIVNTGMREGDLVTTHINNINSFLSRVVYVNIKFDDELQALLLLFSLPDRCSGTVTAITNSSDTSKFTFAKMRDLILGEDVRRRNLGGSSGELMYVGRERKNNRTSGSKNRKRSQSRACNDVACWNCIEVGHFRNQCPNDKKELNVVVDQ
ncbi:putative RNA-directed DNA polymerase [Helianthus debilis subsp. tardiflorus]